MIRNSLHARPVCHEAWSARTRTPDFVRPPTGSKSLRARRSTSDSNAYLLARSRRDTVQTIERVEVTVDNLLSNTNTPSQLENRPLHLSPLAHLGFQNSLEGSEINHPDLIYHLIRRDEMPIARVSLPSPHTPKFRFKSGFKPSAYIQPRLYGSLPLISPRLLQHLFPRTHQVRRLLAREP